MLSTRSSTSQSSRVVFRSFWPPITACSPLPMLCLVVVLSLLVIWNAALIQVMANQLHGNDFGKFYYSARAFLEGRDMYGPSPATLMPLGQDEYRQLWNLNPPHFHLPLLPLALLPPGAALAIWLFVSTVALVAVIVLIVHELRITITPIRLLVGAIAVLAFSGTGAEYATGQVSFLLLLPVTLAWIAARRGRWSTAGFLLGFGLSAKPFLLIFIPYLLLSRRIRATTTALVTAVLLFAFGLLVFGPAAHISWLRALGSEEWAWAAMNGSPLGFISRALAASPYYAPVVESPGLVTPLWLITAAAVATLTLVAALGSSGSHRPDRDFGLLLLGAQLVSPLGWVYYLILAIGPSAGLVVERHRHQGVDPRRSRWDQMRRALEIATIPGLLMPLPLVTSFQPCPWATLTLGSAYFWATLLLWLRFVTDRPDSNRPPMSGANS